MRSGLVVSAVTHVPPAASRSPRVAPPAEPRACSFPSAFRLPRGRARRPLLCVPGGAGPAAAPASPNAAASRRRAPGSGPPLRSERPREARAPGRGAEAVAGLALRCPSLLLPPPGPASPSQPRSHSIPQALCPRQRGHRRLCCSRRSLLQRGGNSCPPLYKMESPSPVIRAEQPHVTNQTTASVAGAIKWQKRKRQMVELVPPEHLSQWRKEEGALGARQPASIASCVFPRFGRRPLRERRGGCCIQTKLFSCCFVLFCSSESFSEHFPLGKQVSAQVHLSETLGVPSTLLCCHPLAGHQSPFPQICSET